ncbi:coiled-coil domain-containing protein R3HCC1L [Drosophila teissieri]|uniref:coiled-coil domain-containing protein R3HCC1L n=1 Tax=Drosophila teissieri TaxID=7243 RepID=UPI001CBA49F6|nr:coiled-coil domain-containing protein R3HCC1L [Drosophila teissieri]
MGVKKHISETPLSKSNSVDLYRPPALRNNNSNNNNSSSEEGAAANESITTPLAAGTATPASTSPTSKESPNREQQADASAAAAATRRERRPDRAVYVPRARRSQTTPPTTTTAATATAVATTAPAAVAATITTAPESPPVADTHPSKADDANGQPPSKSKKTKSHRERRERGKKSTALSTSTTADNATVLVISTSENDTQSNEERRPAKPADCDKEIMSGAQRTKPGNGNKSASNGKNQPSPPLRIEDVVAATSTNGEEPAKCDNDVRELQRASKEINRSNRRIMKQTFNSDVLEIPEKIETSATKAIPSPQASATAKPPADSTTEDDDEEDEDDWEKMFDESGDCLDPKILQELSESVGKCKIELPKMDYTVFHIKQQLLNEEEFPHVLEVSNFPVEFKTPDLLMLFAQYRGSGFDIKWVDDTHALAVFSSSRIAAEVLTMGHPFVKLKPLAEATLESRLKAKKAGAVSLQPYRQRPETCTALARRLVSGALGVKLPTAPQERENERRVLREAKERKLLAAKQRDEVWES